VRPTTLTIIGLEAAGVALARQARHAGIRVVGYAPVPAKAVRALKTEAISDLALSAEQAVRDAELIVVTTRPDETVDSLAPLAASAPAGSFLTDLASVKRSVCRAAVEFGLSERFAGSHPMVESSEYAHDCFHGAVVYVCPSDPVAGSLAARQVMHFWSEVMEAAPVLISAEQHDRQIAWTRHLPQAVSSVLAKTLAEAGLGGISFGPEVQDATRPAGMIPRECAGLLIENAEPVLEALSRTEQELAGLEALLVSRDLAGLTDFLARAAAFQRGASS